MICDRGDSGCVISMISGTGLPMMSTADSVSGLDCVADIPAVACRLFASAALLASSAATAETI